MTKEITLHDAIEALDGWDGMVTVTVQKASDAGIDGNEYTSVVDAVHDFNSSVRHYEKDPYECHVITLAKTWPEDLDDEYTSWEVEPVITATV